MVPRPSVHVETVHARARVPARRNTWSTHIVATRDSSCVPVRVAAHTRLRVYGVVPKF